MCYKVSDREHLLAVIESGWGNFDPFNHMVRGVLSRSITARVSDSVFQAVLEKEGEAAAADAAGVGRPSAAGAGPFGAAGLRGIADMLMSAVRPPGPRAGALTTSTASRDDVVQVV